MCKFGLHFCKLMRHCTLIDNKRCCGLSIAIKTLQQVRNSDNILLLSVHEPEFATGGRGPRCALIFFLAHVAF